MLSLQWRKFLFLSTVNKLKGATKANIWQERINEKCSIIIKLSKNVTNRVNQLVFKLSDGNLERSRRNFSKLYKPCSSEIALSSQFLNHLLRCVRVAFVWELVPVFK